MILEEAKTEVKRLSSKNRWPREQEGQLELARVAAKYAKSQRHLRETITDICENWENCPDSRELRAALQPTTEQPAWTRDERVCPLGLCDGSGWQLVETARGSGVKPCQCRSVTLVKAG